MPIPGDGLEIVMNNAHSQVNGIFTVLIVLAVVVLVGAIVEWKR